MAERFFAPWPRGLEQPLAAELAMLRATDIVPAEGGVAFAGELDVAYRANLESRIEPHPLARRQCSVSRRTRALRTRACDRMDAALHGGAYAARRRHGDTFAADEPRVRDAARQGRRLRSFSR